MTAARPGAEPTPGRPVASAWAPAAPAGPNTDRAASAAADGNVAGAEEMPSAQGARADPEPSGSGIPQLAKILGGIVAPSTLVTALLYYFGWLFAYWFFRYFGVDSTVLGLTPVDYVMRSVDVLFIPMTVTAGIALLAFWGNAVLRARLIAGSRPAALRVLGPAFAGCGLFLAIVGFASIFGETFLDRYVAAAPLSLAIGVGIAEYSIRVRRLMMTGGRAMPEWAVISEWAVVFALVGLSLFGAATSYARVVGNAKASHFAANLAWDPSVLVYSERSLSLHAPGVREVRCRDADAAYRYRYDGLTLMLESSDQYLFVPYSWRPDTGAAILIPRSDSLRLEFYQGSPGRSLLPRAC